MKPLLWLWYSFDRSLAGGQNVWLGVELRRLLAKHIFKRCGENFKAFHNVEFSFGYNLEVGDNVVVHRNVLLDDRGGIVLGNNVSISDYANIYSHTHSIVDQKRRHERDDGDRGRRAHHLSRDGARRRSRARARDGRRDGGGDEGRAAVSRLRRHSGEERAREAERAAGREHPAHEQRSGVEAGERRTAASQRTRITSSTGPASPAAEQFDDLAQRRALRRERESRERVVHDEPLRALMFAADRHRARLLHERGEDDRELQRARLCR